MSGTRDTESSNFDTSAGEATKWAAHLARAEAAFAFWRSFLQLRTGQANDQTLTAAQISRFNTIIRAVSWVESRHGTGTGNQPSRDPMQCGNPADVWWRELTGQTTEEDRFIGGPGAKNYDASELPAAAHAETNFPAAAKLTGLQDQTAGHGDPKFSADTSFYWAVPILIHKTNTDSGIANGRTFKCGDVSRERLVGGAVAYNGGGVADYKKRIDEAIDLIGWPG